MNNLDKYNLDYNTNYTLEEVVKTLPITKLDKVIWDTDNFQMLQRNIGLNIKDYADLHNIDLKQLDVKLLIWLRDGGYYTKVLITNNKINTL